MFEAQYCNDLKNFNQMVRKILMLGLGIGLVYAYFNLYSTPVVPRQAPQLVKAKDLLENPGAYQGKCVILADGKIEAPIFFCGRCLFKLDCHDTEEDIICISYRYWGKNMLISNAVFQFELIYYDNFRHVLLLKEVKYPSS